MQRRIRPTAFTSAIAVLGLCAAFGSAAQSLEPGTPLAQAGKADISTPTAAGRIEAVVLKQGYGMGYGGAITLRYAPAVLLRDGSYTTDVDSALQAQPRIDGRWRRDGGGFELIARDGKRARVPAQMRARPADPGATLAGAYRSLSGAGGQNLHRGSLIGLAHAQRDDGRTAIVLHGGGKPRPTEEGGRVVRSRDEQAVPRRGGSVAQVSAPAWSPMRILGSRSA